ncbi:hypothetical protein ACFS5L_42365 [Streptomyces phyllanthi]|uniref:Uncharacterized protein n=1 Tax=Streptomyces phyllanthi TaxID=1803180 RepID=A0A5N8VYE1_9ACTN|nr:hypothetical protein [Streptomyces phyllanthi]MPY39058.1 hypothetical protein [Streptomyces phyllanthi]
MSGSARRAPANRTVGTSPEPPFLSLHTTVVLLVAFVIGLVMGSLTLLSGVPVAGAVVAGLTGAGSAVPVLRRLIGPSR